MKNFTVWHYILSSRDDTPYWRAYKDVKIKGIDNPREIISKMLSDINGEPDGLLYIGAGMNYQPYNIPVFEDILRAGQLDLSNRVRRSNYSYEINGRNIRIYPAPTSNSGVSKKLWIKIRQYPDPTSPSNHSGPQIPPPDHQHRDGLPYPIWPQSNHHAPAHWVAPWIATNNSPSDPQTTSAT